MSTKVTIIDVILDATVDDIISEDMKSLTASAQKEFEIAMGVALAAKRIKEDKAVIKQTATTAISTSLQEAYNRILAAGETGVPLSDLMKLVEQYIPSSSGFATRLKHLLKEHGNPYRINRFRKNGQMHYAFAAFNAELDEPLDQLAQDGDLTPKSDSA